MGFFERFKLKPRKHKPHTASRSTTPSTTSSFVSKQPAAENPQLDRLDVQPLPPDNPSSLPSKPDPEPELSPSLQENIWNRAYKTSREENPALVKAFEEIVLAEVRLDNTNTKSAAQTQNKPTLEGEVTCLQVRQFVQDGITRTKKGASIKQGIDRGLHAVDAVRGTISKALSAAPEAAFVWATFSLGIELLSNPVTEALENRNGVEYVLCRLGWYWELAGLLLGKSESDAAAATAVLREKLEEDIMQLFRKLILYQMRSVCVYHRNEAATIFRDIFRADDWTGQLRLIKDAEEAVRYDVEQYATQESMVHLQMLNNTAGTLQQSLQSIHSLVQSHGQQQDERHNNENDKQCLSDLFVTDPRTDKKNIEEKKGGLLKDCYKWVLEHEDYQRFKAQQDSQILWIKGDPGKGKTMLLCGIIDDLESDLSVPISYFFCQATGGDRLNRATSVLRGLVYHLARQHPQLIKHVREKYDYAAKERLGHSDAWHELCEIVIAMLNDPTMKNAVLVVDALDECIVDMQRLLSFIVVPSPAKWIVSSRNWPDIEEMMNDAEQKAKIHLEMNQDSVSSAIDSYIKYRVDQLTKKKKYNDDTKAAVLSHLTANANGTFLWVALVCEQLANEKRWHVKNTLVSLPPGLDPLYGRMLQQISQSKDAELYRNILGKALVAYRPIALEEMHALLETPAELDREDVGDAIESCGSFLTLHNNHVSFVHQSAKDYLLNKTSTDMLPASIQQLHGVVFVRSLDLLSRRLKRDIYHLSAPGYLMDEVSAPKPDPLASIRYSCIFWVDHLLASASELRNPNDEILAFLKEKYLQWLEALSLLRSIPAGGRAMENLDIYMEKAPTDLRNLTKDGRRFLLCHGSIIEAAPLQVYASALIFSPINSLIRQQYCHEEPSWIHLKPKVETDWNLCLQTLEGHVDKVVSAVFSHDGRQLVSGSSDKTLKIWDTTSGACLQTFEGHHDEVLSVALSNNEQRLVSGSGDKSVKIWDFASGACLQTLKGHGDWVRSVVFSCDGQWLVSGSDDSTIKVWDAANGACLQTLDGHSDWVRSVVFSHDGRQLASGSDDNMIKVWDTASGACLQTLKGHQNWVTSVVFSHDSKRLASGSNDRTVKIWDVVSGACLQTLEGHGYVVTSVAFSHDGQRLASGSDDKTVKTWDATSGACLQTLTGHDNAVRSVVFSHDGQRLATASDDNKVKIWDATSSTYVQSLECHDNKVKSVAFSHDAGRLVSWSDNGTVKVWDAISGACQQTLNATNGALEWVGISKDNRKLSLRTHFKTVRIWNEASGTCLQSFKGDDGELESVGFSNHSQRLASVSSNDGSIKIWDVISGACLQTLDGHNDWVRSVVFSNDGGLLASGSTDKKVKLWDVTSGECLQTFIGHRGWVGIVAFSHDGRHLASGSDDGMIKIWDTASGACLQTLEGHDDCITSVVFSNDERRLASGSDDTNAKIWDVTSGACLQTLVHHDHFVTSVAFSHDGERLASGSKDRTVKIWDAADGACLKTLEGHEDSVGLLVFSHDGQQLISGSDDRTIRSWDVTSGVCRENLLLGLTLRHASLDLVDIPHTPTATGLDVSTSTEGPVTDSCPSLGPNSHHYTLDDDNLWVLRDGERLLWFPPEYRPSTSAVLGSRIGLGCISGRVFTIGFDS